MLDIQFIHDRNNHPVKQADRIITVIIDLE